MEQLPFALLEPFQINYLVQCKFIMAVLPFPSNINIRETVFNTVVIRVIINKIHDITFILGLTRSKVTFINVLIQEN